MCFMKQVCCNVNHERKIVVTLRLVPFIKHSFNPIHYSYVSWWKHVLSISLHCIKNEVKVTYLKKKKKAKKKMKLQLDV